MALGLVLALILILLAACGPAARDDAARLADAASATNTVLAASGGLAVTPPARAATVADGARTASPPVARSCCLRPTAVPAPRPTSGAPLPLEVRDTLYSPDSGYALLLVHNPNPDLGVHRSPYRAALRSEDGRLLGVSQQGLPGSLDQTIFVLPPGGTIVLEPRFVPAPLTPAGIELIGPPAEQFQPWPSDGALAEVAVTEVRPGRAAVAIGQVRNPLDREANMIVDLALFNDAGRLVNGAQDVVEAVPAGGAKSFQILLLTGVASAHIEAQASPARLPDLRDYTAFADPSSGGFTTVAPPRGPVSAAEKRWRHRFRHAL